MTTVYKFKASPTPATGDWSDNTENIIGDMGQQIYVKATTSTTVFDVVITNSDDIEVRKFTDVTGVLNDLTPFPMSGIHTVAIENATVDEEFKVRLCVFER